MLSSLPSVPAVPDAAQADLRIVLLTTRTSHCAAILEALRDSRIGVTAAILEQPSASTLGDQLVRAKRQRGTADTLRAVLRRLRRTVTAHWQRDHWSNVGYYARRVNHVERVASLNSPQALSLLRELEPDIVVLGGAPILRVEIVTVARLGTINAHPGLLPAYRGVDVIPWALLNGDPIGVTVHLVDAGIDSGAMLRQSVLAIEPGDTIERLRSRAETLAGRLVAETVSDASRRGRLVPSTSTGEEGTIYRRMSREDLARAAAALRRQTELQRNQ